MLSNCYLQECVFTKQSNLSFLHVIFEGSMRVGFCNSCCKRWFFAFNDVECANANIEARLRGTKEFAGMEYRHVRLEGYCAVPAGEVLVELWVQDCFGQQRAPEVPFVKVDLNPRVTVEEINLSDVWNHWRTLQLDCCILERSALSCCIIEDEITLLSNSGIKLLCSNIFF